MYTCWRQCIIISYPTTVNSLVHVWKIKPFSLNFHRANFVYFFFAQLYASCSEVLIDLFINLQVTKRYSEAMMLMMTMSMTVKVSFTLLRCLCYWKNLSAYKKSRDTKGCILHIFLWKNMSKYGKEWMGFESMTEWMGGKMWFMAVL